MAEYMGKRIFTGDYRDGDNARREYLDGVKKWIDGALSATAATRADFMPPGAFAADPEKYRRAYLAMIGDPYPEGGLPLPQVREEYVGEDEMCHIRRLQIEVLPGVPFYGILFLPHGVKKAPLVIAQHGGGGIPEKCCDMAGENNYDFFSKRALAAGAAVFAPQLLLWNFHPNSSEAFAAVDIPFDRGEIDRKLRMLGLSVTGFEVFCIRRALDHLSSLPEIDGGRVGMMGLSYGGYFSLYTAAADTRIQTVYAAAAFNDRTRCAFADWVYPNAARTFSDGEVAGLCAPRRVRIDVGRADPVFDFSTADAEAERARAYFAACGAEENFCFCHHGGGHRFASDGGGFDFFFAGL